jgi:16S rRNA processing protein RimM
VKTQGRHGEVAVELFSSVPDRFAPGIKLWALADDGSRRELELSELWPHKGLLVFKFDGVDSMSDAETLIGCELQVPSDERARLEPGWTFVSDLVGCSVISDGVIVGVVQEVLFGAGEAPLLQVRSAKGTQEIPYAEAYLKSVDIPKKEIVMQLPEGLLELNAPLTAEEKAEQQRKREKD